MLQLRWALTFLAGLLLVVLTLSSISDPAVKVNSIVSDDRLQELDNVMQSWLGSQWPVVVGVFGVILIGLILLSGLQLQNVQWNLTLTPVHEEIVVVSLVILVLVAAIWAGVNTYNEILYMNKAFGRRSDTSGLDPSDRNSQQRVAQIAGIAGGGVIIVLLGYLVIKNLAETGSLISQRL